MDSPAPDRPHFVVIGDVGSVEDYHVGDDAMLFGLLAAAEHAGLQARWTVVSASPASAAARFGQPAVAGFGFDGCSDHAARQALLAALDALPADIRANDGPGKELRQALPGSAALIVAGGGNLSRSWPALAYERVAAARLARRLGVPVLLTSQSIGPRFGTELRPLIAELLTTAAQVGVREPFSAAWALLLGVPETGSCWATTTPRCSPACRPPTSARCPSRSWR